MSLAENSDIKLKKQKKQKTNTQKQKHKNKNKKRKCPLRAFARPLRRPLRRLAIGNTQKRYVAPRRAGRSAPRRSGRRSARERSRALIFHGASGAGRPAPSGAGDRERKRGADSGARERKRGGSGAQSESGAREGRGRFLASNLGRATDKAARICSLPRLRLRSSSRQRFSPQWSLPPPRQRFSQLFDSPNFHASRSSRFFHQWFPHQWLPGSSRELAETQGSPLWRLELPTSACACAACSKPLFLAKRS